MTTEWIQWTGGECPIPDAKAGEYSLKLRDGRVLKPKCSWALDYSWGHTPSGSPLIAGDIIAYRLIEKEQSDLDWLEGQIAKMMVPAPDLAFTLKEAWALGQNYGFDSIQKLIRDRKEAKS